MGYPPHTQVCLSRFLQTVVYIKTVKDYYAFRLSFPIPYQGPLYQTRPAQFVGHFVGHEGSGSICAFLKQKGWLVDLSAGYTQDNRSVPFFDIAGTLTKEGYCKPPCNYSPSRLTRYSSALS